MSNNPEINTFQVRNLPRNKQWDPIDRIARKCDQETNRVKRNKQMKTFWSTCRSRRKERHLRAWQRRHIKQQARTQITKKHQPRRKQRKANRKREWLCESQRKQASPIPLIDLIIQQIAEELRLCPIRIVCSFLLLLSLSAQ